MDNQITPAPEGGHGLPPGNPAGHGGGKHKVSVSYGEQTFTLERGDYTGAQLAAIFGVPAGYELDLIDHGGKFDPVASDEVVKVKDGLVFVSHPPSGQSS